MKTFEFEKAGYTFCFRNPQFNRYSELVMEYKIISECENKDNDGYYYNSEYSQEKKAMTYSSLKIKGKKIGGVTLPDDMLKEIEAIHENFKATRKANIQKAVNELISGTRNIHFSIVGSEYPEYQAWVENLSDDLDGKTQDIMMQAITAIMGKDEFVSNSCDYLNRLVYKTIGNIEIVGNVLNPQFNSEIQKYHGFNEKIVTGFDMNLMDILQTRINRINKEASKLAAIFETAKTTGKEQLISKYSTDCNDKNEQCDLDMVYVYAMPDGTEKSERTHTW